MSPPAGDSLVSCPENFGVKDFERKWLKGARGMTKKTAAGFLMAGGAALLGAVLLWTTAAAHGSGEIEIFAYLLEEPGFLRLTAGILGALIFLLGAFIVWQSDLVWGEMSAAEKSEEGGAKVSRARMMAPGAAFALTGAAIILAAIFILPDRVTSNDHPGGGHQSGGPPRGAKAKSALTPEAGR